MLLWRRRTLRIYKPPSPARRLPKAPQHHLLSLPESLIINSCRNKILQGLEVAETAQRAQVAGTARRVLQVSTLTEFFWTLLISEGFDRPSTRSGRRFEPAPSRDGRTIGSARQEDSNPLASHMSLYDFRKRGPRFRWSGMNGTHLVIPDTQPEVPLACLGYLGKTDTTVMALKVTRDNGFEAEDTVAAKLLKYKRDEDITKTRIEVQNLRSLSHNHIVAFVGTYANERDLGLLMFPVAAWDLESFLKSPNVRRKLEMIRPWFRCLARVTKYLHTLKFPFKHRDIKPANILIDKVGAVFLTDFGISKQYESAAEMVTHDDTRLTIEWASPQRLKRIDQGEESDVFSLGCVFLHMATVLLGYRLDDLEEYLKDRRSLSTGISAGYMNPPRQTQPQGRFRFGEEYESAIGWANKMKIDVSKKTDPNLKDYQRHLAKYGIDVIVDMIRESAKAIPNGVLSEPSVTNESIAGPSAAPPMKSPRKIDLEEVATEFDKICLGRCRSCDEQVGRSRSYLYKFFLMVSIGPDS